MKIPEKNPAEQIFNQFCEGYKQRDLTALLNLFTKNVNMWGSRLDEYRVGLKEVEEQLKKVANYIKIFNPLFPAACRGHNEPGDLSRGRAVLPLDRAQGFIPRAKSIN